MGQRKTDEEVLAEIAKRKAQLEAREKLVRGRVDTKNRKQETRKNIIIGALVRHHAETNPDQKALLAKLLAASVKDADKALFPEFLGQ